VGAKGITGGLAPTFAVLDTLTLSTISGQFSFGQLTLTNGPASRTIEFNLSLQPSSGVSAVPLPPALPMFALALLMLFAGATHVSRASWA
jgi:hypothetical protein